MKKISLLFAALLSLSIATPASAGLFGSSDTASDVTKDTARTMNKVMKGVILQVSDAKIEEADGAKGNGATAGAVAGGALGGNHNGGSLTGALVGSVVGAIGGAITSATMGSQTAQDLIIQLESNGDIINITQAVDDKVGKFVDGEAVLIVYKGEKARVIRNKIGAKPIATGPAVPATEQPQSSTTTAVTAKQ